MPDVATFTAYNCGEDAASRSAQLFGDKCPPKKKPLGPSADQRRLSDYRRRIFLRDMENKHRYVSLFNWITKFQ